MSDEFDIVHIDHESSQEIIDWAVSAAAMVILMDNAPAHSNTDEAMERLEGYIQAIQIMLENMPDVLVGPAAAIAQDSVDSAIEDEQTVEQFRQELDEL